MERAIIRHRKAKERFEKKEREAKERAAAEKKKAAAEKKKAALAALKAAECACWMTQGGRGEVRGRALARIRGNEGLTGT